MIPDLFLSGSKSIKVRTAVTFSFSCISVEHLNKLVLVQSKHQIFCFIRPKSPDEYNGTGCDDSSGYMRTTELQRARIYAVSHQRSSKTEAFSLKVLQKTQF